MVECLPSIIKALGSGTSTNKRGGNLKICKNHTFFFLLSAFTKDNRTTPSFSLTFVTVTPVKNVLSHSSEGFLFACEFSPILLGEGSWSDSNCSSSIRNEGKRLSLS